MYIVSTMYHLKLYIGWCRSAGQLRTYPGSNTMIQADHFQLRKQWGVWDRIGSKRDCLNIYDPADLPCRLASTYIPLLECSVCAVRFMLMVWPLCHARHGCCVPSQVISQLLIAFRFPAKALLKAEYPNPWCETLTCQISTLSCCISSQCCVSLECGAHCEQQGAGKSNQ